MHFYDEVQHFDKIPIQDSVRRIYMARHIIEKYIAAGKVNSYMKLLMVILNLPFNDSLKQVFLGT